MSRTVMQMATATRRWMPAAWVGLATLAAGCASVESTMVTRDESNQTWEKHQCLNGIPITLKVPTHLKLYVFHKHFLEPVIKNIGGRDVVDTYRAVDVGVVVRDFAHEFMYTDKVFVVDYKRPPAGNSNMRMKMTDQQYIDEIQHDVTDTTISQVQKLFATVSGTNFQTVAASTKPPDVTPIRSLVAVGIFEIDSPDFEMKVKDFMETHVNQAHDAWVVPPGVDAIHRTSIHPGDNTQVPYPGTPFEAEDGGPPSAWVEEPAVRSRR